MYGTGLEVMNHRDNRNSNNQIDPNERRDTFRDLWNDEVGREIGRIGVFNNWTPDSIADYAKNAVVAPPGSPAGWHR